MSTFGRCRRIGHDVTFVDVPDAALRLAVALGIGLLLGAERERHMGRQSRRGSAGIRTFALASLVGGVSERIGGDMLTAVVALVVGSTALAAYWRNRDPGGGITTEAALMVAFLLGVLAQTSPGDRDAAPQRF